MTGSLAILNDWYKARYGFLTACVALIFLACFVLVMKSRQDAAKRIKQRQTLNDYTFPNFYFEEVKRRYPYLALVDIEHAFEQLRVYFLICWQQSPKAVAMPSRLVDLCWHIFIIDTRAYQQFCQDIYGRFLHHQPHVKVILPRQDEDQENTMSNERKHQHEAACAYQAAIAMTAVGTAVPMLFGIDQEMGIPDGFIYSPEMLKFLAEFDLKANKSSAAYSDLPLSGVICADLSSCSDGGATASGDACSGSD